MVLVTLLSLIAAPTAQAAEVVWSGHYRGSALLYNSLSLANVDANENSLGLSAYTDHRLRLAPTLHVGSRVAIHGQVDFVPFTMWGDAIATRMDPVSGENIPMAYADGVSPYADADDGASYLQNLQLTRAYADVYTPVGRLRFGRMPREWGAGIWLNPGNDPIDEYGDTGDRVQFTTRAGPVYLMGAWEMLHEGFIAEPDDMQAVDFAVAYQAETMALGLYNRYRYQPSNNLNVYTGDLWGFAQLGPVRAELEVVGVYGGGDLDTGANDITIASIGGMLDATIELDKLYAGLEVGYANGDGDLNDSTLSTFTFDPDHNPTLMLFEEPMPLMKPAVVNETNGGLDFGAVRTGDGISNAMYLNPRIGYNLREDLSAELSVFGARMAVAPTSEEERKGYGWEFDLTMSYRPIEHFEVVGTGGLFMPGSHYSAYENDDLGGSFDGPALGGRLQAIVDF